STSSELCARGRFAQVGQRVVKTPGPWNLSPVKGADSMTTVSEPMTAWQRAWRVGIAPQLSRAGLLALKRALVDDDPALIQGATTQPPPLQAVYEWPVEGACAISYAGWKGEGLKTVGEVEGFFARVCYEADQALGEAAGCRHFLTAYDEWS